MRSGCCRRLQLDRARPTQPTDFRALSGEGHLRGPVEVVGGWALSRACGLGAGRKGGGVLVRVRRGAGLAVVVAMLGGVWAAHAESPMPPVPLVGETFLTLALDAAS